jgi:hypothetical protein
MSLSGSFCSSTHTTTLSSVQSTCCRLVRLSFSPREWRSFADLNPRVAFWASVGQVERQSLGATLSCRLKTVSPPNTISGTLKLYSL